MDRTLIWIGTKSLDPELKMGRKQNQTSQSGLWIDLIGSKSEEDITINRPKVSQEMFKTLKKIA